MQIKIGEAFCLDRKTDWPHISLDPQFLGALAAGVASGDGLFAQLGLYNQLDWVI